MKRVKTPTPEREYVPALRHLDFCISTHDNRDGLEQLLHSIAEDNRYKGATIYLADSNRTLDRAYYKQLRTQLGEAGLITRLKIHHIAYKANLAVSRNFLVGISTAKYKVFLTDNDYITKDTDLLKFVALFDGNKAIGVIGGVIKADGKKQAPEGDGKAIAVNGVVCEKATAINDFMAVRRDLFDTTRYNPDANDPLQAFCSAIKKAPYEMVTTKEIVINRGIKTNDNDQTGNQPNGAGPGAPTQPTVPSQDGRNGGGSNSAPSGQDEESKNTAAGGRQGGGGA